MPNFQLEGSSDPFLLVSMKQGEKIFCESDALVVKENNLVVKGAMRGGILKSALRRYTTGESFFQQSIEAVRGDGDCVLSPTSNGDIKILDIGPAQYMLSDGAYLACTADVNIDPKLQTNIGGALFGGNGGFVAMQTKGHGQLCISGNGILMEIEVTPEQGETTIDNGHVVAWDSNLNYSIGLPDSGGGVVNRVFNSMVGGEGLVLKFSGRGKVVICSRKRNLNLEPETLV